MQVFGKYLALRRMKQLSNLEYYKLRKFMVCQIQLALLEPV